MNGNALRLLSRQDKEFFSGFVDSFSRKAADFVFWARPAGFSFVEGGIFKQINYFSIYIEINQFEVYITVIYTEIVPHRLNHSNIIKEIREWQQ